MSVSREISETPGDMETETHFEVYEGFMTGAKILTGVLVVVLMGMAFFLV